MSARRSSSTASLLVLALSAALAACRSPVADASGRTEARTEARRDAPLPSAAVATDLRADATPAPTAGTYAKPDDAELRRRLTPLQYQVTQREATEPPFRNAFWDNHSAGLYVDVATGEPLFGSADKFESGTGWPSFTRPVDESRVKERRDDSLGSSRVEVRSAAGDSHLGHVFDDGPAPTNKRYCINSAALRFIPVDRLQAEGYGAYMSRFAGAQSALPPSTKNSCAAPAPGEKPGCSATLDSATLAGPGRVDGLRLVDGVLEVTGPDGGRGEARVTYDPSRLSLAALVDRWKVLGGTSGAASP